MRNNGLNKDLLVLPPCELLVIQNHCTCLYLFINTVPRKCILLQILLWIVKSFFLFVCFACMSQYYLYTGFLTQSCSIYTVGPFIRDLCSSTRTFQYNLWSVLGAWWFRTLVNLFWWYSQVIRNVPFPYCFLHVSLTDNSY